MLTQYEEKMTKTVENLEGEYATIRAGRANPNILNKIKVEYYGVPTPMQQLANITVPEARTLMIAPWEPSLVKAIEKAILNSDLGLTPNNDGKNSRSSRYVIYFIGFGSGTILGSATRKPDTSVQFSYTSARLALATIEPVTSEPPREKVLTFPSLPIP